MIQAVLSDVFAKEHNFRSIEALGLPLSSSAIRDVKFRGRHWSSQQRVAGSNLGLCSVYEQQQTKP